MLVAVVVVGVGIGVVVRVLKPASRHVSAEAAAAMYVCVCVGSVLSTLSYLYMYIPTYLPAQVTSQPPFDLEAPPTRLRRSYRCRLALCEEAVCQHKRPRRPLTLPHRSLLGNLFRSTVLGATSIFEADDPTTARLRPSLVSTRSKCPIARQCLRPAQLPATCKKSSCAQMQRRLARNQCHDGKHIPTAT
ncbi:uncharacterized protein IWZ02DRAFT_67058 [Phyllosticta citriasiana]|uniref:uncharacterized protein n=1 Tax=Phyllosticta citriasiana TaxID=595635 RepID=UPI0030FD2848